VTLPITVAPSPPAPTTIHGRGLETATTEAARPATTPPVPSAPPPSESTLDAPVGIVALRDGRRVVWSLVEHAIEVRNGAQTERTVLGEDPLPPDVSRGRRLFLAADDTRLTSGGLACGGCHPDGADDGLVWFLQRGPRQTPTLPGRLTPPFNWNGTAWTMEENIAQTVRRLGGTGIPMTDVDAIAAYVTHGLPSPSRAPHAPTEMERHGQELFATVGACAPCHDPTRNYTDGQPHELGGLGPDETERRFDTPSLRFAGATAPYFHDGRYATLEAVLRDPTHRMGHVEGLSGADVDALAAYLRTL
jgi:mono/diheme cytochrome c family protein